MEEQDIITVLEMQNPVLIISKSKHSEIMRRVLIRVPLLNKYKKEIQQIMQTDFIMIGHKK